MFSLKVHNILDYVIGAILVICPYVFGFSNVHAARNVFLVLGFGLIGYSLLTNYRYSVVKAIPVSTHMALDVLLGIVLMLSPTVFRYSSRLNGAEVGLHFILGFGAIALVALTNQDTGISGAGTGIAPSAEKPELKKVA